MTALEKINAGSSTTAEALEIFDALETLETGFMLGTWKGEGFHTGHPLDGLLEAYHWHGKHFAGEEDVHPLLFTRLSGGYATINPAYMGLTLGLIKRFPVLGSPVMGNIFQVLIPLFSTSHSSARLRMTTYRGKTSATMIYDQLPINDVFRKLDENTVLGVMDMKGMQTPFFFILRRLS